MTMSAIIGLIGLALRFALIRLDDRMHFRAASGRIAARVAKLETVDELMRTKQQITDPLEWSKLNDKISAIIIEVHEGFNEHRREGLVKPPNPIVLKIAARVDGCFTLFVSLFTWLQRQIEKPFIITRHWLGELAISPQMLLDSLEGRRRRASDQALIGPKRRGL